MSNEKMRESLPELVERAITGHPGYAEFAAWCRAEQIHPYQIYFLVWQASRAAVAVELPAEWVTNIGTMLPPHGVRRAIEAQGLKVKP